MTTKKSVVVLSISTKIRSVAKIPHVIPYQGSKRKLAPTICAHFPAKVGTLYEPFAGSAAITIHAAYHGLANHFVIGDTLRPLVELHETIIEKPATISDAYERIWTAQPEGAKAIDYFLKIREQYNRERDSERLLFLILRCVANAVRFAKNGNFSQSPDKRRRGTHPDRIRESVFAVSKLLKGKTEFCCADFATVSESASHDDLVYMDPPYQGTTDGADKRYFEQLDRERLIIRLREMTTRGVPFILSYDGQHGEKKYGEDLPVDLHAYKMLVRVGRSTQGTLNGKEVITYESIYLSHGLRAPREEPQYSFALM